MARRLSSLFHLEDTDKALPAMPPDSPSASPHSRHASRSRSPAPTRLRKPAPAASHSQARAASGQYLAPSDEREPTLPALQDLHHGAPSPLLPPPPIAGRTDSRSSSLDRSSRPGTPNNYSRPSTPTLQLPGQAPMRLSPSSGSSAEKHKKKSSWFGKTKKEDEPQGPAVWISGHPQKQAYDTDALFNAQPLQELWDDVDGNCYIYLFPQSSGKGASFRVDSTVFASSPVLTRLAFGDVYSQDPNADRRQMPLDARTQALSLSDRSTPPTTPPIHTSSISSHDSRGRHSNFSDSAQEAHLYLPIKLGADAPTAPATAALKTKTDAPDPVTQDLQALIDIRNLFAFLCGQSLIATERKGSLFQIFMSIAGILKTYEFSNLDGSTYGEVPSSSFDTYVDELGLADVRASREKTIEGVVLGERMRSIMLYNEAFTHAVGKLDDLVSMKSPKFNLIMPITQNRLARAAMDLEKRTASIRLILHDFDFPSLFNGIMNSKMSVERKEGVRFDEWKDAFFGTRKWAMSSYHTRYGHWPPKASSKKNDLETSGLNRMVLRDLYHDMTSMYDLLVNRSNLTTRTVDGEDLEQAAREEPTTRALRSVLSEYDRSSPPVKPPVPFDLPIFPDLRTTRPEFGTGDTKKDAKAMGKKLKDDEIAQILRASWNDDAIVTPFVDAFREMEKKAAHGCTISELVDLRVGQWIFMYVVLQALPMLACDAQGIKWTQGVEYFLCEPPRSGVPWANPNVAGGQGAVQQRTWFSVGEGGGVVSLPSDIIEHGVEGIYHRSHCWVMAEKWSAANPILNSALQEQVAINAEQLGAHGDGFMSPPTPTLEYPPAQQQQFWQQQGPALSRPQTPSGLLRPGSRASSPAGWTIKRHSSLGMGLEALPLPVGVTPDGRAPSPGPDGRPMSRGEHAVDASKTFDAILADLQGQKGGKRGRKK
ncbi:hypothetical protein LTR36_003403 [Oleoguttula mirabilis]|uniref:DUF8004 domain-containing protein n=1 Tax=Oleoguttula mirabilis TaxID=1507867 RepID=A0AAV9JJP8_9PEZI|nr:hypothetical protein LTR36_003403 [Oleoguttula mirabilis]